MLHLVALTAASGQITGQDAHALAEHGQSGVSILNTWAILVVSSLVVATLAVLLRLRTKGDVLSQQATREAFVAALKAAQENFMAEIQASRDEREAMALRHEHYITQTGSQMLASMRENTQALRDVGEILHRVPCLDGDCPPT